MPASVRGQASGDRMTNRAVAVGVGLDRVEGRGVLHVGGSFRFNWWDEEDEDIQAALARRGRSRMKGFLEAEAGYWKESDLQPFESDLLVGLNAIAVIPTRSVDLFFGGGFGVHFLSASDAAEETGLVEDETRVGANIQFGVDLNLGGSTSVFALGRYDLLQGENLGFQSRIMSGVRYRF